MPVPLIVANWKMNKNLQEAQEFIQKLKQANLSPDREVVICPPFTLLYSLKDSGFKLGGQGMFWEEKGAYTGEISPSQLKDAGCEYVIIGHSERRQYFNETDETVNKKLQAALKHDLKPIVCVGEKLEEREKNQTFNIIKKQLTTNNYQPSTIIAYEPVWAIGTGKNATPQQAQEVHQFIKKIAKVKQVIYGGSVNPENISQLMAQPDIMGVLVGGASLDPESFIKIINFS